MSVVCCRNRCMNLAAWAERKGVARLTAYRWRARLYGKRAVQNRAKHALAAAASDDAAVA